MPAAASTNERLTRIETVLDGIVARLDARDAWMRKIVAGLIVGCVLIGVQLLLINFS